VNSRPQLARVFLDTNVFVARSDTDRAEHQAACDILDTWPTQGTTLYSSDQVFREYLVVATRPPAVNGLGLSMDDAQANVSQFMGRVTVLRSTAQTWTTLEALLRAHAIAGRRVHDANIAATAISHGISDVVTYDTDGFAGLPVTIVPLAPAGD